jgi:hypothetical protein
MTSIFDEVLHVACEQYESEENILRDRAEMVSAIDSEEINVWGVLQ